MLSGVSSDRTRNVLKWVIAILLLGFVIYLIADSFTSKHVSEALSAFLEWMEDNIVEGSFAFAGVYVLCTVLFVPGSVLTLGEGYIYGRAMNTGTGVALGSAIVFISASIGACLSFLVGRFVLRECSQRMFDKFKVMRAVDKALETKGTKLMLLLRLSPLIPFNALNYVLGVTSVSFMEYLTGCLGMIPGTIAFVYIGTTISEIGDGMSDGSSSTIRIVVYCLGGVATLIAAVAVSYHARKVLNQTLDSVRVDAESDLGEESELTTTTTTADSGLLRRV